jgi:hypothetical protein
MEAAIMSIRCGLEETIKTWVEGNLASVNQWRQGLHEELNTKMEETQLELQVSVNTQTQKLQENTAADIKKDLHEEIHPEIEITWREFETEMKEVEARAARMAGEHSTTEAQADHGSCGRTGIGAAA